MKSSGSTLNVMHAILTLEKGGAQEVVRILSRQLKEDGHNVTVCTFEDGPVRAELESLGIPVEVLRRPRYSVVLLPLFLLGMLRIRRQLGRLIESYGIDIIQTHLLQVLSFLVLSLRSSTRLRVVLWTIPSSEFLPRQVPGEGRWLHSLKHGGYLLSYHLLSRHVDGIIAVSDAVRSAIIKLIRPPQDKVFTIYNGVDTRRFDVPGDRRTLCSQLGLEYASRLIVCVGRLSEEKGHRYLIEATRSVVERFPTAHVLLAGDGPLAGRLKQQAAESGFGAHIHFLGLRRDVPGLLASADLFVLPSLWEGFSLALLEAMAAGKPIVATAVSGTSQALRPGETGLIVPPGDSGALAEAIIQLLSDRVRAKAMGREARHRVERDFSARRQVAEHVALYRRSLAQEERP